MIKVEFTQTAQDDYLFMLEEISNRSLDEALILDEKMDALIDNLRKFKYLCPPSKRFPKFRRCVVTRHIALVYELGKNSITVISIYDTRSNSPFQ